MSPSCLCFLLTFYGLGIFVYGLLSAAALVAVLHLRLKGQKEEGTMSECTIPMDSKIVPPKNFVGQEQ